jgi:phosphinothricin acetyltransferase
LSSYREKEAFKSTVELSIYIGADYRGKGIASALMDFILKEAKKDAMTHTVVSVITAGNEASRKLHKKFNFEFCGTIKEVGVKFGEYRDIENYSLKV